MSDHECHFLCRDVFCSDDEIAFVLTVCRIEGYNKIAIGCEKETLAYDDTKIKVDRYSMLDERRTECIDGVFNAIEVKLQLPIDRHRSIAELNSQY